MSERVCKGCGTALPPKTWQGRDRVWCSERCRKRHMYGGACIDCGALTDGSNGRAKAPQRCSVCSHAYEQASARWNRETVAAAIRRWAEAHGRQPTAGDWLYTRSPEWPSVWTVQTVFGSWNTAIEAAGFVPLQRGHRRKAAA